MPATQENRTSGTVAPTQETKSTGTATSGQSTRSGSDVIGHAQNTIGTQGPLHFVFGMTKSQVNTVGQEPRSNNSTVTPTTASQESRSSGTA